MKRQFLLVGFLLALIGELNAFQVPRRSRINLEICGRATGKRRVVLETRTPTSLEASPVVLAPVAKVALSCLVPTSLGFFKSEYGVSYGYGTSVALVAALVLQQLTPGTVPYYHALALLFYGTRLDLFLLYREVFIPKFRKFRDKIEEKAPDNRLSRTPFILSCALLYACLGAPLFVTSTCTTCSK